MKTHTIILAIFISLNMQQAYSAMALTLTTAAMIKILAVKLAIVTPKVVAVTTLTVGTHLVVSHAWDTAREKLDLSARAQIDALHLERKQFNDAEMRKDALYAETLQKLQTAYKQGETTMLGSINSAQMQFARYCDEHKIASNAINMPQEGVRLRNQIELLYYCLGTINL